ncbi:MAG: hypothetical protein J5790_07195 [Bacteroidaceae bacterium]|nr:hypothetical protein [Bacteroidaceae bacterium]
MKKISLWATMLAMLVICGLCVTSCGKDDEEEDSGGGNNGGKKETVYPLEDYFNYYYYRCERVGANLVIEMAFENTTGQAVNNAMLQLKDNKITDNIGNVYYVNDRVFLTNTNDITAIPKYSDKWNSMTIPADGYAVYIIKILNFDSSNTAKKLSFDLTFGSSSLPAESYDVAAHDFVIDDNRVMEKGIQTNDTALVYKVTNCERVGSVLQIDFSVTNNSEIEMGNLTFLPIDYAKDDLGNAYYCREKIDIAFGDSFYKRDDSFVLRLKAGETANGRIRIRDFDSTNKAKYISAPIQCSSNVYALSDNVVRFLTIPVKDNRVLYDDIQKPDFKLNVKLSGTEVDEKGTLYVNFTIQNNTGETLRDFTVDGGMNWIYDDLSNKYYSRDKMALSINNSDYIRDNSLKTTIPVGSTISGTVAILDFSPKAKNVTFDLGISCDNFEFADNKIHFITIPVLR